MGSDRWSCRRHISTRGLIRQSRQRMHSGFSSNWQDFTYEILLRRLKVRNSHWGVPKGHFPDLLCRYYRTKANVIGFAKRRAWEQVQRHKRLKDIDKRVFAPLAKNTKPVMDLYGRIIWRSAFQPSGMNADAAFSFGSVQLTKRLSFVACESIEPMSVVLLLLYIRDREVLL